MKEKVWSSHLKKRETLAKNLSWFNGKIKLKLNVMQNKNG